MPDIDIIDGLKILSLMQVLQNDRTLIKLRIPARDFNHLTIVTAVAPIGREAFFQIDYPRGFKEATYGIEEWRLKFEFTGSDNLPYAFATVGGERVGKEVWVKLPDHIERQQKRDDFRLRLPYGTKIYLSAAEAPWKLRIENLSRGGVLGVENITAKSDALFQEGDTVADIQIHFPKARENKMISIKQATIRRVDKDAGQKRRFYAFQFTEVDRSAETLLVRYIYDLQREFLRRRLPMDA